MANFTEIGQKIGNKIDTRIEKTKEWTKAHKKQLIIVGAVAGATGVGATAVYFGGKKLKPMPKPEQIPESIEEVELDTDSAVDSEVSQD